ncbi:MAG: TetR/AcrR family transcriptional regulator [Desulfovibrio sp.]|nr:TetR/AcrR family transcriptional regulator [Desulfovibrio sp.]
MGNGDTSAFLATSSASEHPGKGRPCAFDRGHALRQALRVFWRKGYAPTTVAELCRDMGINPPSLYASFGNKASLFIEAVQFYERAYWEAPARRFLAQADVYKAVADFFDEAARILLCPETPCGCMVVLAAVNIPEQETRVIAAIRKLRRATKAMFTERLRRAIADGQIPVDADVPALAGALNTLLEGMSFQARDGLFQCELKAIAAHAVRLLPAPQA